MYVQHEKKMYDAKIRVYMRKNCIFVPISKWSTFENSQEGGNASEGVCCEMVNIVTDKLFLHKKLKISISISLHPKGPWPANKYYDGCSKMLQLEIFWLYQKYFSKKEEEHAKLSIS